MHVLIIRCRQNTRICEYGIGLVVEMAVWLFQYSSDGRLPHRAHTHSHTHASDIIQIFKTMMYGGWEHSTVVRCGLMAFKCFSEIQTISENYPKTTPHKWIHAIAMYAISSPSLWLQQAVFLLHSIETGWHKPSFCVTRALFAISSHLNHWQQLDLWYVFISTILLRWAAKAREKEGMREKMKDKK